MLTNESEKQGGRTKWVLGTILVVACVVAVGVVAHKQRGSDALALNEALLQKNVPSDDVLSGEDLARKEMWKTEDEDEFRELVTVRAKEDGESQFVERLVAEWRLGKKLRAKADVYWTIHSGQCSTLLGGNGGHSFSFINFHSRISHVCGRRGSLLDRIQPGGWGAAGGGGGSAFCYSSPTGCIKAINIRTGSLVDGLQFVASNGHVSHWYGGHGGGLHHVVGAPNTCLFGIYGRSGSLVDALGFCFK